MPNDHVSFSSHENSITYSRSRVAKTPLTVHLHLVQTPQESQSNILNFGYAHILHIPGNINTFNFFDGSYVDLRTPRNVSSLCVLFLQSRESTPCHFCCKSFDNIRQALWLLHRISSMNIKQGYLSSIAIIDPKVGQYTHSHIVQQYSDLSIYIQTRSIISLKLLSVFTYVVTVVEFSIACCIMISSVLSVCAINA